MLTVFGACVVTFMMLMYALENRGRRFVLASAVGRAVEQLRVPGRHVAVRDRRGDLVAGRRQALSRPTWHPDSEVGAEHVLRALSRGRRRTQLVPDALLGATEQWHQDQARDQQADPDRADRGCSPLINLRIASCAT